MDKFSSPIDISDFLASTEIFKGLDRSVLDELADKMEWVRIKSGETLISQQEVGDCLYILVNGRLRLSVQMGNQLRVISEIGRGESVGEAGLLTGDARPATVQAIRDCELLRFSREQFFNLVQKHPQAITSVTRSAMARIQQAFGSSPKRSTVSTIALLPASPDVPIAHLAHMLTESLNRVQATLHINSQTVDHYLGPGAAQAKDGETYNSQLLGWLTEQENHFRWVLYEADFTPTPWTMRCMRQADRILIVGVGKNRSTLQQLEEQIFKKSEPLGSLARRDLILIQPDNATTPYGSKEWKLPHFISNIHHLRLSMPSDIERLARLITGRAVGLVLGGGGARGFAHIGLMRAIVEAGIPIDIVGGTSIGALFSAECAMGWDIQRIYERTREVFFQTGGLLDYTFPLVSLVSGRKTQRALEQIFGSIDIEDLWLNYFCISANLTRAETIIHQEGALWKAVRASTSLPGVFPPVYYNGDLLVDGGLFNILPIDIMAEKCEGGRIIGVDVASEVDLSSQDEFETSVSGWSVLWSRLNPVSKKINIPYIFNVLLRASDLGGFSKKRQLIERGLADIYIRPPINTFGTLEFESFGKIVDVGYRYGLEQAASWKEKMNV